MRPVAAAGAWLWPRLPFGGFIVPWGGLRVSRDGTSPGNGALVLRASPSQGLLAFCKPRFVPLLSQQKLVY